MNVETYSTTSFLNVDSILYEICILSKIVLVYVYMLKQFIHPFVNEPITMKQYTITINNTITVNNAITINNIL